MNNAICDTLELFPAESMVVGAHADHVALMDYDGYAKSVLQAEEAFEAGPSPRTAIALSRAIIHGIFSYLSAGVGVCINCSWGKDSTAVLSLVVDVMYERKQAGLPICGVVIAIAHTGNEFVDMERRIEDQNAKVKAWAAAHGLDITVIVARPEPKDTLLSLLAGAGYALPKYGQGNHANTSNWCVDRLKVQPIAKAIAMMRERFPRFVQFLGVRSSESSKRGATISRFSEGLPIGLSRLSTEKGDCADLTRMAVQPIAHWSHDTLRVYLREEMALWDPYSFESLKVIYRKGANEEDLEGVGECSIVRTVEGGVSTVCSDLSGARFGCLFCVRSRNQSLRNIVKRDPASRWLQAVHGYIYHGIRQHQARLKDLTAHGFTNDTMFCKGYTFRWRYTLLMFVFRAEMETGATLLQAEEIAAIQAHWERSGVLTVTPEMARKDAAAWKATAKLRRSYEADAANFESLSFSLPAGIPSGVYAWKRNPEVFGPRAKLAIPNLIAFAGHEGGYYPQMRAYVFKDHSSRGGYVTVLTDAPSDLGKKLNTNGLSGFEGFALEMQGSRDLTAWERRLTRGRIMVYRHDVQQIRERVQALQGKSGAATQPARNLQQMLFANEAIGSCEFDKVYADHLDSAFFLRKMEGKLDHSMFDALYLFVFELVLLSEDLTEAHAQFHRNFRREIGSRLEQLRSDDKGGDFSMRDIVQKAVSESFDLDASYARFLAYTRGIKTLNEWIERGEACVELVARMAYITRTSFVDEEYAGNMMRTLKSQLKVA